MLEAEDLHNMFGWLESLVKNPFSEDDSAPVMPGEPCPYTRPPTLASPSTTHTHTTAEGCRGMGCITTVNAVVD